ncbi:MAG: PAS domain S-box protein [Synechococcaceae cyanobacterium SM2_3_60]|nr:PAS domain S-box protein [Synechococcaceae cyanobacterium SM2_3_60]
MTLPHAKKAELALEAAQQHFQTLAENSPDIIARFDRELRRLYVSPALEHLTGLPAAMLLGKTCRELEMDPVMVATFEAAAAQALATAMPQRIEFETPTRVGLCTFEMVMVPEFTVNAETHQSEVQSLLCISRDVTRYREALRAFQASEQRLATLISNLPGFVYSFLHIPEYPAIYLSEGVESITGYSAQLFHEPGSAFGEIMNSMIVNMFGRPLIMPMLLVYPTNLSTVLLPPQVKNVGFGKEGKGFLTIVTGYSIQKVLLPTLPHASMPNWSYRQKSSVSKP